MLTEPDVPPVITARLRLVSLSSSVLRAMLEGRREEAERETGLSFPSGWPDGWLFRTRLEQMTADPTARPWLLRAIGSKEEHGLVVGHINFHDPPAEPGGRVEIGYTIEEPFRRKGFATEAVLGMLEWAEREHAVTAFRASVGRDNAASLALLARLGFVQTGTQWDELDGEELVFELDRTPST